MAVATAVGEDERVGGRSERSRRERDVRRADREADGDGAVAAVDVARARGGADESRLDGDAIAAGRGRREGHGVPRAAVLVARAEDGRVRVDVERIARG